MLFCLDLDLYKFENLYSKFYCFIVNIVKMDWISKSIGLVLVCE